MRPTNATDKRMKLSQLVTVKDIYKYTPSNIMIKRCYVRRPQTCYIERYQGNDCLNAFTIRKFFTQEFICYRLHLKKYEHSTYNYLTIGHALTSQGMLYLVDFNMVFKAVGWMSVIAHDPDSYPHVSSAYSTGIQRRYNYTAERADFNALCIDH